MIDFTKKRTSYYFTETDLKKILLEVFDPEKYILIIPLKRKQLIREIDILKDQIVGKHITEKQLEYLKQKKEKNREPEYLNYNDIDLIEIYYKKYPASKIKKVQHVLIKSFIGIGFRVQEICDFDVNGIDKENNRIRILGKGKKWRWTHVEEDFITLLLGFKEKYNCNNNPVLKNSYGIEYKPMFLNNDNKPFTPRNIQKFMETITKNIQELSQKLHPHLLRHTYGIFRVLKNPTLSPEELRQDMGHDDIRTTQGYFRLAESERIRLAKRRQENKKPIKEEILKNDDPLHVLKLRLANSEITPEEYKKRKELLEG